MKKPYRTTPSASVPVDPAGGPGFLLWQATMRWQRVLRGTLTGFGLTHVQFLLLADLCRLESQEGPVTQARLADHARVDPMMNSQVLRAMEGKGWLERKDHPEDARAFLLRPTAKGRALLRRAAPAVEAVEADFFDALGKRRAGFQASLRKLG